MSGKDDAEVRKAQKRLMDEFDQDVEDFYEIEDNENIKLCRDMPGEDDYVNELDRLEEKMENFPEFNDGYTYSGSGDTAPNVKSGLYYDRADYEALCSLPMVQREIELEARRHRRSELLKLYEDKKAEWEDRQNKNKKRKKLQQLYSSSEEIESTYSEESLDDSGSDSGSSDLENDGRISQPRHKMMQRKKQVRALTPGEIEQARIKRADLTWDDFRDVRGALVRFNRDGEPVVGQIQDVGECDEYQFHGSCTVMFTVRCLDNGRDADVKLTDMKNSNNPFTEDETRLITEKFEDEDDVVEIRAVIDRLKARREKFSRDGQFLAALKSNRRDFIADVKREEMEAMKKLEPYLEEGEKYRVQYEEIKSKVEQLDARLQKLRRGEPVTVAVAAKPSVNTYQVWNSAKMREMRELATKQQTQQTKDKSPEESLDSEKMKELIRAGLGASGSSDDAEEDEGDIK